MSLSEDMARLTTEMRVAYDSRIAAVGVLQEETATELADMRAAHQTMAATQQQELDAFKATLQKSVADMLHEVQTAHQAMSTEQRRKLDEFTSTLHHDVTDFLHVCSTERGAMGRGQRQQLDVFMADLRERTQAFIADTNAVRMEMHADHVAAQKAWQQHNQEMQQSRASSKQ